MAWRAITIDNVRLTPVEKAKLQSIEAPNDVGAEILQTVVGEFIGAIQAGGNQVVTDGTIPDVVRPHVINRTRWLWLLEIPTVSEAIQSKERKAANDAAEKFRDQIATGHPKIEPPPAPSQAAPLTTMPSVGDAQAQDFTQADEDGI